MSHTLGVFPNNKTYVFMMNFYTAVQFVKFRAYYGKLQDLTGPLVNNIMFLLAMVTCVSGPLLALFDRMRHGEDHEGE